MDSFAVTYLEQQSPTQTNYSDVSEGKMKTILAVFLCLLVPATSIASEGGYKVAYDGGSLPALKAGKNVRLFIEQNQVRIMDDKEDLLTLPASSITEVSYGQDVHRRIGTAIGLAVISLGIGALMMFSKSKKHFVGITWNDDGKKGGMAIQCDKNNYRGILAGLEGITGK